ncbi:unnamed protein product [Peronospora belbahrii]|uniref:dUTPase-like domain-containing protein n=1 Tax=Peronospora belbahrii TaxID=622444 RepID=A0AAU9KPQ4_9STRA|nr:unnamed protein product [Peronospora belbahrii]
MISLECGSDESPFLVAAKTTLKSSVGIFISGGLLDRRQSISVTIDNRSEERVELDAGTPLAVISNMSLVRTAAETRTQLFNTEDPISSVVDA